VSNKYPDSKGDIIALVIMAISVIVIALLASFFKTAPAHAFPHDAKVCADAGNRPGTTKPAYCLGTVRGRLTCVPCRNLILTQWVGPYRNRTWSLEKRRRACQQTKRCW
jgi:hypothetical protein